MRNNQSIKVLIVDDSALVRQTLIKLLSSLNGIEVIATASDPYSAVHQIKTEKPDVITLDIQMPRMDGLTFLRKIMTQHPIPVVVVSSLTSKESQTALDAYNYGAIAVLEKPNLNDEVMLEQWRNELDEAIRSAAHSKASFRLIKSYQTRMERHMPSLGSSYNSGINKMILIGSSAGGTEVIASVLSSLGKEVAPILIVQHMPEIFTASYASRLNENSNLSVKEAEVGDLIQNNHVFVAPGNQHMEIKNTGLHYVIDLNSFEKINRHRPSVDVLFESANQNRGIQIMAILLSGMGHDGASAMLDIKKTGGVTIAQDEQSSIVYGMPKEAVRIGAADYSLSIKEIVAKIESFSLT